MPSNFLFHYPLERAEQKAHLMESLLSQFTLSLSQFIPMRCTIKVWPFYCFLSFSSIWSPSNCSWTKSLVKLIHLLDITINYKEIGRVRVRFRKLNSQARVVAYHLLQRPTAVLAFESSPSRDCRAADCWHSTESWRRTDNWS